MCINEVIQFFDFYSWMIVVDIVWLYCDFVFEFSCCCVFFVVEFIVVVREFKIFVVVQWIEVMKMLILVFCVVLLLFLELLGFLVVFCGILVLSGYNEQWMVGYVIWYGEFFGEGFSGGVCGYIKFVDILYGFKIVVGNDLIF